MPKGTLSSDQLAKRRLVTGLKKIKAQAEYALKYLSSLDEEAAISTDLQRSLRMVFRQASDQLNQLGHPQPFKE